MAYAKPYVSEQDRRDAFPEWLHVYNHHRSHTALKGLTPATASPTSRVSTRACRLDQAG